jgi:hypothetical protein
MNVPAGINSEPSGHLTFFEPHPLAQVHAAQPANTKQAKTPIRHDMRET